MPGQIKISGLPTVASVTLADLVPIVQSGITSQATMTQVLNLFEFGIFQVNQVVFNTSGSHTYTQTTGTSYVLVQIGGAGGGSGGAAGTAGQMGASGGAGGGGYSQTIYSAANLGSSSTVSVGAGGGAGVAGNNPGGNGGNTTFTPGGTGTVITAGGGIGSPGSASTATNSISSAGGGGGTGSMGGTVNLSGGNGSAGIVINGSTGVALPGSGGSCPLLSSAGNNYATTSVAVNQNCQGAPGVLSYANVNIAGQAGGAGLCVITEFITT